MLNKFVIANPIVVRRSTAFAMTAWIITLTQDNAPQKLDCHAACAARNDGTVSSRAKRGDPVTRRKSGKNILDCFVGLRPTTRSTRDRHCVASCALRAGAAFAMTKGGLFNASIMSCATGNSCLSMIRMKMPNQARTTSCSDFAPATAPAAIRLSKVTSRPPWRTARDNK